MNIMLKTKLHIQSKQSDLENQIHILTESPKEGFTDTFFNILWKN